MIVLAADTHKSSHTVAAVTRTTNNDPKTATISSMPP